MRDNELTGRFRYELERGYGKPYGEPSEETPAAWLPRLIALGKIKPETRIWVQGWPDWYEYQDCRETFGVLKAVRYVNKAATPSGPTRSRKGSTSGGNALVPGYDDDINSHLPALEDKLMVVLGAASGRTVSAEYVHVWS